MSQSHAPLWSLSPQDGRYESALQELSAFWSEGAFLQARIRVELQWLSFLSLHVPSLFANASFSMEVLQDPSYWDPAHIPRIKEIEEETRHDMKAVEYYLRERLQAAGLPPQVLSLLHFGLTSEDVNNLAYGTLLRDFRDQKLLPMMEEVQKNLHAEATRCKAFTMMSRTHGQGASPTTMGKELVVAAHRLARQTTQLAALPILGKLNGAVGNYHGLAIAMPDMDWPELSHHFITDSLHLTSNPWTTQIENHDNLIEHLDCLKRYNTISLDLCQNMWWYISFGYFQQKKKDHEVGSSVMPHKVNPIDFENAEGNFGLSSGLIEHLGRKLPVSRLQRDLSDSTVLRNIGVVMGYHWLGQKSLCRGLGKLQANPLRMKEEVKDRWELLGEALQTCLRREGVLDAYERVKAWSRGKECVNQAEFQRWLMEAKELSPESRLRLQKLIPHQYTGLASQLVETFLQETPAP